MGSGAAWAMLDVSVMPLFLWSRSAGALQGGLRRGVIKPRGLLLLHQCGVAVSQFQGLVWLSVSSRPPSITLASASCSPWLGLVRSVVHRQGGLGPHQWPGSSGVVWVCVHAGQSGIEMSSVCVCVRVQHKHTKSVCERERKARKEREREREREKDKERER